MTERAPVIHVKNMYKRFGSFTANSNITFDVFPGEIFGFLGANGAGKTTAIRILCGLSSPSAGTVMVNGLDASNDAEEIKKSIGYMSQKFSLYEDLTLLENIRFYGGIYGLSPRQIKERSAKLVNDLDIGELRHKLIGDIPLGWKQKLAFAVSMIHEPPLVFLDEPTGGVDPITRRQFWELIYQASAKGVTVFVTTHYMDEAEYCDRLCILSAGEVKTIGTPKQVKEAYRAESIDEVFYKISRGGGV